TERVVDDRAVVTEVTELLRERHQSAVTNLDEDDVRVRRNDVLGLWGDVPSCRRNGGLPDHLEVTVLLQLRDEIAPGQTRGSVDGSQGDPEVLAAQERFGKVDHGLGHGGRGL